MDEFGYRDKTTIREERLCPCELYELFSCYKDVLPALTDILNRKKLAEKIALHGHLLIAYRGSQQAGFAAFYANDNVTMISYLSLFAIKEQFRGTGIGRDLLKAVESISVASGMNRIRLEVRNDNVTAIGFYKHLNFTTEAPCSSSSIYMIKDCEIIQHECSKIVQEARIYN